MLALCISLADSQKSRLMRSTQLQVKVGPVLIEVPSSPILMQVGID